MGGTVGNLASQLKSFSSNVSDGTRARSMVTARNYNFNHPVTSLHRLYRSGVYGYHQKRGFASFAGSSLKAGMVFLHSDKYCEVISNRQVKQGRGSASIQLEYIDLSSKKQMTLNLPIGAKVEKVDLERQTNLFQYLDEDSRELVVSDHNFEESRIPMALASDGAKLLEPGDELQIFYHDRTIVKIGLPNNITSRMKKK